MSEKGPFRRVVRLQIEQGLHIRACSNVVAIVEGFTGSISIAAGEKKADATSMFDLLMLAALPGTDLILEATGEGSEEILDRLETLLSQPSSDLT